MSAPLRLDRPDSAYTRLRDLIIRGRIAPGARIVEADIAQRLGLSRTPTREALQRLHQEGLLTTTASTRRTELVVAPLTRDDVLDLYHIMASLEGTAARCIEGLDGAQHRALARNLRHIEDDFEAAATSRRIDYDRVFELHNQFHDALVTACKRPRLITLIGTVRPQVDRYEWMYAPLVGPDYSETFAEHAAVIRAVREGSGRGAQAAIVANWERGAERLASAIDRTGGRGDW